MKPAPFITFALTCATIFGGLADTALGQTYRPTRQIRGVWLRPPTSLIGTTSLETNLQNFAAAGVTDLFLETFYEGVSTGRPGVFRARYSYDYLQEAIVRSARYGIRVHAWVESGFWQFGANGLGAYNFTVNPPGESEGNPEWRVISSATGQSGGDQPDWYFANLAHPGVQNKLRNYMVELASYQGLWGIQTDYHRYPLDDNTTDSNPAPWSFDTYSRNAFMALYGATNDPLLKAISTSGSTGTYYSRFISWRKTRLTEAARQLKLGIDSVAPRIEFSAAMFAVPSTSKCQDWPSWASSGLIDWLMPMAYSQLTSSIANDLNITNAAAAGRRVVAGLYTDSTLNHPALLDQLTTCVGRGVNDWAFFSGPTFAVAGNRDTLSAFILSSSQAKQRGDLNNDGYLDAADWAAYTAVYSGTSVTVSPATTRLNYNGDGVINEADWTLFKAEFARWRFGEAGVIDQRSYNAFFQCLTATQGTSTRRHMFDFNGDGVVDALDRAIFLQLVTVPVTNPADADGDGWATVDDMYRQNVAPVDISANGVTNATDTVLLERGLRLGEFAAMRAGRR